jgi:hypothetical protein
MNNSDLANAHRKVVSAMKSKLDQNQTQGYPTHRRSSGWPGRFQYLWAKGFTRCSQKVTVVSVPMSWCQIHQARPIDLGTVQAPAQLIRKVVSRSGTRRNTIHCVHYCITCVNWSKTSLREKLGAQERSNADGKSTEQTGAESG